MSKIVAVFSCPKSSPHFSRFLDSYKETKSSKSLNKDLNVRH